MRYESIELIPRWSLKRFLYPKLIFALQFLILIVTFSTLVACNRFAQPPEVDRLPSNAPSTSNLKAITLDNTTNAVIRQTVYVPIYSHIYTVEQSRTIDLTATLSVRNTDLANPMIITAVDYYNSSGKRV